VKIDNSPKLCYNLYINWGIGEKNIKTFPIGKFFIYLLRGINLWKNI